jgi:hypothetical protein
VLRESDKNIRNISNDINNAKMMVDKAINNRNWQTPRKTMIESNMSTARNQMTRLATQLSAFSAACNFTAQAFEEAEKEFEKARKAMDNRSRRSIFLNFINNFISRKQTTSSNIWSGLTSRPVVTALVVTNPFIGLIVGGIIAARGGINAGGGRSGGTAENADSKNDIKPMVTIHPLSEEEKRRSAITIKGTFIGTHVEGFISKHENGRWQTFEPYKTSFMFKSDKPNETQEFKLEYGGLKSGKYRFRARASGTSSHVQQDMDFELNISNVELLSTFEMFKFAASQVGLATGTMKTGSTNRVPAELIDLKTGVSFNITWAVSSNYHTDWTPMSEADMEKIKRIRSSTRHLAFNDPAWANTSSWSWTARTGVLKLLGRYFAVGFHLFPHASLFNWYIENGKKVQIKTSDLKPLKNLPDEGSHGHAVGGHMCMCYKDRGGGMRVLRDAAKEAYKIGL